MGNIQTTTPSSDDFPDDLRTIEPVPKRLYYIGDLKGALRKPRLAIVGSRKVTPYGRAVTTRLAKEAAAQGIVIVSGLALGVDGIAHQAALDAKGTTVAILPNGLGRVYPSSHRQLAERILRQGGALMTEYAQDVEPFKTNFIERNRIVSGISDAVLITEAAAKSGTLHTANFALEQGKTVMAVPGNITSEQSVGTNNLIKSGATPVTELRDILAAMGLDKLQPIELKRVGDTAEENIILELLAEGVSDASELLARTALQPHIFNQSLTMLEINGKIRPIGAGHWGLT